MCSGPAVPCCNRMPSGTSISSRRLVSMHRHSAQSLPSGTWAGHLPCLSLRTNQSASGVPNSHTSRTAKISRTSQECAAGRTAIGVVEQPEPEDFPPEVLTTFLSGKPRRVSRNPQKRTIKQYISGELHRATEETVSFMKFALQLSQLYAMYGVLFEMPASLFCPGGTVPMPAQCISLVYFAFFAVPRLWMRGKLLPQTHNTGMLPLIAFIFLVVAGHWATMYWYGYCLKTSFTDFQHPVIQGAAATLVACALALHIWAARALGKAYDCLVKPDKLVRSGPYAWCQHPVYTSYILLFMGYALYVGSWLTCLLLCRTCIQYFVDCARREAAFLEEAFGNEYRAYSEHTGCFLPRFS